MTAPAVDLLSGHRTALGIERESRRIYYAPPPRLSLSGWADKYRMLSSVSSAEPGRWRTDWFEPLREIMDAISDPTVERVSFQKPAQVGWTELIGNTVGFHMDLDPAPMLVVQPDLNLAKMWSKERFDPLLKDTPRLRGKITNSGRREKNQTLLYKTFPGGFMAITGAQSAAGLRARPIRILIGDERDAYVTSARGSTKGGSGEGDPWSLAIKRTSRFWNRKILEGSTPTVKGLSAIERAREQGSDAEYFCPCPHCGYEQTLVWGNVRWESGLPDSAQYVCGVMDKDGNLLGGCGAMIEPYHQRGMVLEGHWVHKHPERRKWRSFWINALYALPWPDLASEWLASHGKAEERKVFINTRLAQTYEDSGERLNESELEARRGQGGYDTKNPPTFDVPMRASVITAGVDTQGDRLEVSVWAYGAGEEMWLLDHLQLWGSPAEAECWRQLDAVLTRPFRHESGATLHISCMAIDRGGHHASEVDRYCMARRRKGVWALIGVGGEGRAPLRPPARKSKNRLWTVGSNAMKDTLFAYLKIETQGPGYMHFPNSVDAEYFKQLTSERRMTTYLKGRPTRAYVEIPGRRHEALDCAQYALAALYMLGPIRDRLQQMAKKLEEAARPAEPPAQPSEPVSILPQLRNKMQRPGKGWAQSW